MIKDKESTLKITTDEIEKKFGKGAIMRLGESTASMLRLSLPERCHSMSLLALVEYRVAGSSRSMALNQAVRPQSHFISSLKRRRREASLPSSMLNMRSTCLCSTSRCRCR